jgi:AhpD family alkylhydroperoxidase
MQWLRNLNRLVRVLAGAREHRFDLVRALARRPALLLATGAAEFGGIVSNRVPPTLKMLAEFRVASIVGCEFCLDIGAALAEYEDLDQRKITELSDFETSDAFSEDERLVLRFATALSQQSPVVTPELRAAIEARFSKAQVVELAAVIAHEHERSRFYLGIDLPVSRFASADACRLPAATGRAGGH